MSELRVSFWKHLVNARVLADKEELLTDKHIDAVLTALNVTSMAELEQQLQFDQYHELSAPSKALLSPLFRAEFDESLLCDTVDVETEEGDVVTVQLGFAPAGEAAPAQCEVLALDLKNTSDGWELVCTLGASAPIVLELDEEFGSKKILGWLAQGLLTAEGMGSATMERWLKKQGLNKALADDAVFLENLQMEFQNMVEDALELLIDVELEDECHLEVDEAEAGMSLKK